MDAIDRLVNEWAWRTESGIPDINDPKSKAVLDNLISELTDTDGQVSKKEIIQIIQKGDFTPEQLQSIFNGISSIAYKADIIEFLSNKGRAVEASATRIFTEFTENGDAESYHRYITGNPVSYSNLGSKGNLLSKFQPVLSDASLKFLMDLKPSVGNVATGKGEVFLCVLTSDVNGDTSSGDVGVGGKGVEVKNASAIPMGQKAQFGKNSDKTFIEDVLNKINSKLEEPLDISTRGKRPFHRLNIIIDALVERTDTKSVDVVLHAADEALYKNYPGLDLTTFSFKNFKYAGKLDADKVEIEFGKKVIDLYVESEDFEEVFFMNDKSGEYAVVPASKLSDLAGSEIKIWMKDGLPRWSYNF